MPKRVRI